MSYFIKNKIITTLSVSLTLSIAHFGMAEETLLQDELASLNTEPCALSEETIKEEVSLSLDERFYQAVTSNDLEEAKRLIGEGADSSFRNRRNRTPLHHAVVNNHLEMVALLIESGADLDAGGPLSSPLYLAIQGGNLEAARLLVEAGANVNLADFKSYTPLHELVSGVYGIGRCPAEALFNMAELLIEYGADVNAENDKGLTPLHSAYARDARITELLIEHGANVNAKDHNGNTPLHLVASQALSFKHVKLLLDSGADVNAVNANWDTPLHLAINKEHRRLRLERLLIASGANMYAMNKKGKRPLDMRTEIAAEKEQAKLMEKESKGGYKYLESLKAWFFGEPICELDSESEKYLDWNKLSYFEGKPTGVSSGSVMLDKNGAIWYVKHPGNEECYAKEYLCGKLLQLISSTNIQGSNFSEVKLVKNYKSMTLASKVIPGFQGLVNYGELEEPVGAELVTLAMFLIQHADGHGNNVGVVLREDGEAEMALIDYDLSMSSGTGSVDADMFDGGKGNLSELLLRQLHYPFMDIFGIELNGEALQDAAAVIAGIARDDIIQIFEDAHKDILETGVSISESKINAWRDALLGRYDIICAMAEKMDYFTLVK